MRLFKGIIGLVFIFLAIIFVYDIRFAIIFVSSYIFHELWHLILIKSFHFKVEEIHLIPFGGQIKMNCKKNHSPLIDAFIYLAGPLGNAILLVLSFIIKSDNLKMINKINEVLHEYNNPVVIACTENIKMYNIKNKIDIGSKENLEEISKNLFTDLRKVDKYNPDIVIIEGVNKSGMGLAIMNRLIRACEYNYIEI